VKVKRSYDDPCGVARALDAVGERWALLVVRELLHGPKRFSALSGALPGMSQNVLSQRLRELEDAGLVARRTFGPPASARGYELTERGYELEPVLLALGRWGSRIPVESGAELSVDALILALRTTFDPMVTAGRHIRVELRLGDDRFLAEIAPAEITSHASTAGKIALGEATAGEIAPGEFIVARGIGGPADATLVTDAGTLRAVVFGGLDLAEAERAGWLHVEGDQQAAAWFTRCFPRPATI
jgi:DNA-binding HxlR family transcriptional regulator